MPPLVQLNFRCCNCQRQHRLLRYAREPRQEEQPEVTLPSTPLHLQLRLARLQEVPRHRFGTEDSAYRVALRQIQRRLHYANGIYRIVMDGIRSSLPAPSLFVGGEKRWGRVNVFHAFPGYVLFLKSSNTIVFCGNYPSLSRRVGCCILRAHEDTFRRVIWYF